MQKQQETQRKSYGKSMEATGKTTEARIESHINQSTGVRPEADVTSTNRNLVEEHNYRVCWLPWLSNFRLHIGFLPDFRRVFLVRLYPAS